MKKLLPLLMVLLLLSSCAGSAASPPSPTPSPTPASTPSAVVEGAEPDLLIVYDGENSGVFASTGEVIYPCAYDYISRVSKDRIALAKLERDGDNTFVHSVVAIGDMAGNLLTDFVFSYIQNDDSGSGLFFATYDYALDKGAVILDAKTCEPLMEMPDSCILAGGSAVADSFIIYDYRTGTAGLYSISGLRAGNTKPAATLEKASYLRSYDEKSGVAIFVMADDTAAFFGGNGSVPPVFMERVHDLYNEDEDLIPVSRGGLWGYADPAGNMVIQPEYDAAEPFAGGLAPVLKSGIYGYIDQTGAVAIKPQYAFASSFAAGFAVVRDEKGEGFLIDRSGNKVLLGVESIYSLSNTYDIAQIDGAAQEKQPRKYWLAGNGKLFELSLADGLSPSVGLTRDGLCCVYSYDYENGKDYSALIDTKTGICIVEPGEYEYFTDVPSQLNSPSLLRSDCFVGYRTVHNARLCDLIDSSGNRILVGLNEVYSLGEAVAAVRKGFYWGIMDFTGKWICAFSVFNSIGVSD